MNIFAQLGVDPLKFAIQLMIFLIPTIWATVRVVQYRFGIALACWLFAIWRFPFIGSLLALFTVTRPKIQNT
jgi:hypothetical protein